MLLEFQLTINCNFLVIKQISIMKKKLKKCYIKKSFFESLNVNDFQKKLDFFIILSRYLNFFNFFCIDSFCFLYFFRLNEAFSLIEILVSSLFKVLCNQQSWRQFCLFIYLHIKEVILIDGLFFSFFIVQEIQAANTIFKR